MDGYIDSSNNKKKKKKKYRLQTPYYPAAEVEKQDISKASEMNR